MTQKSKPITRLCFVDCQKPAPECVCRQTFIDYSDFKSSWFTEAIEDKKSDDTK